MLRFLVGAACVAVIAAVGYYFWGEYSRYADRQARLAEEARARTVELISHINGPECRGYTDLAVSAHNDGTLIDADTRRRLGLCISREELWPFDRDELKRIGLYDELATAD